MKHEKAIKKVEKALGVKVEEGYNGKWHFQYENKVCSWYKTEKWDEPGEFEARSFHVRREDDHSDIMTDYFAGCHLDNLTQLIEWCKPPEAKFSVGTLVRGKQNKRATRHGYAGRIGLVTKAGKYMNIDWCGDEAGCTWLTYPERDIELVSAA